jgi:hypothetical protein
MYWYRRIQPESAYTPRQGAQTVAIEAAVTHLEFRSENDIFQRAHALDSSVTPERVRRHCDWQVDVRQIFEREWRDA